MISPDGNHHASGVTPVVDLRALFAIATRHGLAIPSALPQPWVGAMSRVYPCGDMVIKIPFDEPAAIHALVIDERTGHVARAMGVETPETVAFDDSLDILPVPFAVKCRIGRSQPLRGDVREAPVQAAWRDVGRQLALVHQVRDAGDVPFGLRVFWQSPDIDPRPWLDELVARGATGDDGARWSHDLLDALAPNALADVPIALCHGDVNASNVLVDRASGQFRALVDWAGAGWLDPVWDFAAVSLDVVPFLLKGHREIVPLPQDHSAEARICWCQIQTRLYAIRGMPDGDALSEQVRHHLGQLRRFVDARVRGRIL
jgi:hypothetical protein